MVLDNLYSGVAIPLNYNENSLSPFRSPLRALNGPYVSNRALLAEVICLFNSVLLSMDMRVLHHLNEYSSFLSAEDAVKLELADHVKSEAHDLDMKPALRTPTK